DPAQHRGGLDDHSEGEGGPGDPPGHDESTDQEVAAERIAQQQLNLLPRRQLRRQQLGPYDAQPQGYADDEGKQDQCRPQGSDRPHGCAPPVAMRTDAVPVPCTVVTPIRLRNAVGLVHVAMTVTLCPSITTLPLMPDAASTAIPASWASAV